MRVDMAYRLFMEKRSTMVEQHLKNWRLVEVVCGLESDASSSGVFLAMVSSIELALPW